MYNSHVTCLQFSDIDDIHSDVGNKTRSIDTNVCGVNVLFTGMCYCLMRKYYEFL